MHLTKEIRDWPFSKVCDLLVTPLGPAARWRIGLHQIQCTWSVPRCRSRPKRQGIWPRCSAMKNHEATEKWWWTRLFGQTHFLSFKRFRGSIGTTKEDCRQTVGLGSFVYRVVSQICCFFSSRSSQLHTNDISGDCWLMSLCQPCCISTCLFGVVLWRLASCFLSESASWKVLPSLFQGCVSGTDRCLLIVDINLHGCPPDSQTPAVLSQKDNPCEDRFSRLLRGDTSLHERLLIQGWLCAWTWRVFFLVSIYIQMKWVSYALWETPSGKLQDTYLIILDLPFWKPPFSSGISQHFGGESLQWQVPHGVPPGGMMLARLPEPWKSNGMCGGFGQNQLGWKRAQIHQWLDCMPSRELIDLIANYTPQSDLNANDRL